MPGFVIHDYHFLLQRYLDASVMSGGALEELGVSPEAVEECGIYQADFI